MQSSPVLSCPTMKGHDGSNGSPVSIVSILIESSPPLVVMSEDGAEVTIGESDMEIDQLPEYSPPRKERNDDQSAMALIGTPSSTIERHFILSTLPTHSLMDDVASPSPMTPQKSRSRLPSLWCGGQNLECFKCDDQQEVAMTQQTMEKTISKFLGSSNGPEDWCSSWQAWSYFEFDTGNDERILKLKDDIKRVLRNRASNTGSRESRISNLKNDICPFDSTPKRKGNKLSISASFCEDSERHIKVPKYANHNLQFSVPSPPSACIPLCNPDTPFVIRSRMDDELFYDSDPEETTKRRFPSGENTSSRIVTPLNSSSTNQELIEIMDQNESDTVETRKSNNGVDFKDDLQVYEHVQEFMNQRFTAVWHPNDKSGAPRAVVAWIERGQHFSGRLIQPRLVWKKINDGGAYNDRQSVDLLDISRILEVERIDRSIYPIAKPKTCFLIHSLDDKMMFEASSQEERNRLCCDLKLVVARLGSQVIMDDPRIMDEFFVEG